MSYTAILVDEKDNEVGTREGDHFKKGDIVRISALWLENSQGEILITKRSMKKKYDPGLWSSAAAGTLEPGESYEDNIYKEAEEEIGLTGVKLKKVVKYLFWRPDGTGRYVQWYRAVIDWPIDRFRLQDSEVAAAAWISRKQLKYELNKLPEKYVDSTNNWRKHFLN